MARSRQGRVSRGHSGGLTRRTFVRLGIAGTLAARLELIDGRLVEAAASSAAGHEARFPVRFTVNAAARKVQVTARTTLLDALRGSLGLRDTERSCDRGWCGACTVLVDGVPSASCTRLAIEMEGRDITTPDGVDDPRRLGPRPFRTPDPATPPGPAPRRALHGRWIRAPEAAGVLTVVDVDVVRAADDVVDVRVLLGPGERVPWAGVPVALVLARNVISAGDAAARARIDVAAGRPRVTLPRLRPGGDLAAWRDVSVRGDADAALAESPVKVRAVTRMAAVPRPGPPAERPVADAVLRGLRRPVAIALEAPEARRARDAHPPEETRVSLGADRDGRVRAWTSETWTLGGGETVVPAPLPALIDVADRRHRHLRLPADLPPAQPWPALERARACLITLGALDELAARLALDPLDVIVRNLDRAGDRAAGFETALRELAGRARWNTRRPPGEQATGARRRGLGLGWSNWDDTFGASIAEVEVDVGTGEVRVLRLTAALETHPHTDTAAVENERRRGLLAGVSLALCDERVIDPVTGRVLRDVPTLIEHPTAAVGIEIDLMPVALGTGPTEPARLSSLVDDAGAAMISPAAAVSAAVAHAAGVRVTELPVTPGRVIAALEAVGISP